jgi:hypothetical protein
MGKRILCCRSRSNVILETIKAIISNWKNIIRDDWSFTLWINWNYFNDICSDPGQNNNVEKYLKQHQKHTNYW